MVASVSKCERAIQCCVEIDTIYKVCEFWDKLIKYRERLHNKLVKCLNL
jgi:hypothetical protein